jgi:DNA-binding transcriptional ArsR family regulator
VPIVPQLVEPVPGFHLDEYVTDLLHNSVGTTPYEAIADPTRRGLLRLVAERERTAGELASAFTISRPAVSRHLRVLREAGLVRVRPRARERVYALEPAPLAEVDDWLASIRSYWEPRLDALERHLERRTKETG